MFLLTLSIRPMWRLPAEAKSPSSAKYGPLRTSTRIDRFRHQPVQIRIALAMGMGAHIDRHVVDPDRHVGAVIEIVAAQKILVGFALAAVLGHDQAGHRFQYFPRTRHRTRVEFFAGHRHLARHVRAPRPAPRRHSGRRRAMLPAGSNEPTRSRALRIASRGPLVQRLTQFFGTRRGACTVIDRQRLGIGLGICGSAGAGPAATGPGWRLSGCRVLERRHQRRHQRQPTQSPRHATLIAPAKRRARNPRCRSSGRQLRF